MSKSSKLGRDCKDVGKRLKMKLTHTVNKISGIKKELSTERLSNNVTPLE